MLCFRGDHVMAWSTSIVAPPDGSMGDYMASLDKLRGRGEQMFWPGHGGPVREPQRYMRALAHHRRQREASIMTPHRGGRRPALARSSPGSTRRSNPALIGAASLSTLAHLEDLVARGLVAMEGELGPKAKFGPAAAP